MVGQVMDGGPTPAHDHARCTSLDRRADYSHPDPNRAAPDGLALLRAEVGRSLDDRYSPS